MPDTTPHTPQCLASPGVFRHLAAMIYDFFLVITIALFCVAIVIATRIAIEGADSIAQGERAISGAWRIPTFILALFVSCHFYIYFWTKSGQTLGMQAWRIRLENANNQRVSLKQAYIRIVAAVLSMACFGLGFTWRLWDKKKLSWHDRLSGTHLVLLPKKS